MPGAVKDIAHFVPHEFFDFGAGGAEVLARIKFFRVIGEGLADSGGHREPEVSINVYFGASDPTSDFDISFGNARGLCPHLATELINLFNQVLGHAGSAVEDQGIIAQASVQQRFLDGFEPSEVEMLLAFEFVSAMRIADGDGE